MFYYFEGCCKNFVCLRELSEKIKVLRCDELKKHRTQQ